MEEKKKRVKKGGKYLEKILWRRRKGIKYLERQIFFVGELEKEEKIWR